MKRSLTWMAAALAALLVGCNKPAPKPVAAPPQAAAPAAPEPAKPAEPEPAKAEVKAEDGPEPKANLTGVLLNPKDNVQVLRPEGWVEADKVEGGPLLNMTRTAPIDGMKVTATLTAQASPDLAKDATVTDLRDSYVAGIAKQLEAQQAKVVGDKATTMGGQPALAVKLDLTSDGHALRAKQWIVVRNGTAYSLMGVGPRDSFDKTIEPELNAIASTVTLP